MAKSNLPKFRLILRSGAICVAWEDPMPLTARDNVDLELARALGSRLQLNVSTIVAIEMIVTTILREFIASGQLYEGRDEWEWSGYFT